MFEPDGPLPPEIYLRRRVAAIAVAVVAVVLLVLTIFWISGSGGESPKNVGKTSATTGMRTITSSSTTTSGAIINGGGGPINPGGSATPTVPSVPATGTIAPSETPVPVPASGLCPDQNISLVLYTDKPSYAAGEKVTFTLAITNAGLTECVRDVGANMQNISVLNLAGDKTLWSLRDCAPIVGVDNQKLTPSQQIKSEKVWGGTTSSAQCTAGERRSVAPGAYQAIAKLGEKASAPITFNITKAG